MVTGAYELLKAAPSVAHKLLMVITVFIEFSIRGDIIIC